MIICKFGHFTKEDQDAINDEYQQEFPDDEKEFNDLITIPYDDLENCIQNKYKNLYLQNRQ